MKKIIKAISRFLNHFTMTFIGIITFIVFECLCWYATGFGVETSSWLLAVLGGSTGLMMVLYAKAVYDDFRNSLYRYIHFK